ncbi:MAG: ribosomal protein S18-alanine N-acetyltransferase [Gemmatimonadota bacterium]|nr:ribosomal protein S18-alanine N-acetyltransferase [Gemmatimonadota bacterium]
MTADAPQIRPATADDLEAIHAIERASFGDPWSRAAFAQALRAPEVTMAVAAPVPGPAPALPPALPSALPSALPPALPSALPPALPSALPSALLGFVALRTMADEGEILNVAVAPAARRSGVGRALVRHALASAAAAGAFSVFLEVRPSNAAALTLYRSFGFVEVGRRHRYYRAPVEDALVLRRGPAVRPLQP